MADVAVLGFWKYWRHKLASLKSESHAITQNYPQAAALVQQVHKVLNNTDIIPGCTLAKVWGEGALSETLL
jgi:hypothetical protein